VRFLTRSRGTWSRSGTLQANSIELVFAAFKSTSYECRVGSDALKVDASIINTSAFLWASTTLRRGLRGRSGSGACR
jgi:hypothetical protein